MNKSIKITEDTHTQLLVYRYKNKELQSIDEAIKDLLKKVNAWEGD